MSVQRKINVFSSVKKLTKEPLMSSATTLKELKEELMKVGVDISNKTITEYTSQKKLDESEQLPEGELRLYVMPQKTNSGEIKI